MNGLKQAYLDRRLGFIHSIHGAIAKVEKAAYRRGWLSPQRLTLPHFLGIGATKAATTWLYNNLKQHPDIFMPETKELHYFDRRYDEPLYIYTRKFKKAARTQIRGEITPAYSILSRERIAFVRLLMPEVRLIFIARNPIERAWSEAMHLLLRKGRKRALDEVRDGEIYAMLQSPAITQRSDYPRILDNWLAVFPSEQLLLLFYEDLLENPKSFLTAVLQHIGARTDIDWQSIPMKRRFNANPKTTIPPHFYTFLAEQYREVIQEMGRRFGDKVTAWSTPRPQTAPSPGLS